MRLISITCVKNEADIIEAFVRHTASFVDFLVVLDNGSTDQTLAILKDLQQDQISLEIIEDPSLGYHQYRRMTRLMKEQATQKHGADWVVPLDADEFLLAPEPGILRQQLSAHSKPVNLLWKTYIPDPSNDSLELNPVIRIRHRLDQEAQAWSKVIVPRQFSSRDNVSLAQGSHHVLVEAKKFDAPNLEGIALAHFPIRNPGQFACKIALGYLQYLTMPNRPKSWGWHYNEPYKLLKNDPVGFARDFRDQALHFAVDPNTHFEPSLVRDPIAYWGNELSHTTATDADENHLVLQTVLTYAETLAASIRKNGGE